MEPPSGHLSQTLLTAAVRVTSLPPFMILSTKLTCTFEWA
jgi:hypothetical protein